MYQRIHLACECGRRPLALREVGLTPDRQLVIHWRCSGCRKQVYIVRPLAEYWRECPNPGALPQARPPYAPADALFLRRLGIRLPEEIGQ